MKIINSKKEFPKCKSKPMLFVREMFNRSGEMAFNRPIIVYPSGKVEYIEGYELGSSYKGWQEGCTSASTQEQALENVFSYWLEKQTLIFLGYL